MVVERLLACGDGIDHRRASCRDAGQRRLALLDHGERVALRGVEVARHLLGLEVVEPEPGQRPVGFGLAGAKPRRLLGRRLEHGGQPVLVAANAEDGLLDLGERLSRRDHRPTTR